MGNVRAFGAVLAAISLPLLVSLLPASAATICSISWVNTSGGRLDDACKLVAESGSDEHR